MVTLANAFVARGYEVDLVLASAHGPYLKDVAPTVRIVDLKAGREIKALLPLVGYLRRERPAAMLAALTHTNVVAILARMLAKVSTRLVVSERSTISARVDRSQGFVARLVYAVVPKLYGRADGVVAVSQAASEDLIRFTGLPATSVGFIYNPFELNRIQSLAVAAINHPWFKPGQRPVVLAIGRLDQAKDYPTLIRAFARLRCEGCLFRLMILGEGELRGSLEALVLECGLSASEVELPGFVSNPFAYLSRCGVYVLSSRYEGLPGALIEAMACGAPVVSTDCPSGPREVLEDGRWGLLVPVGDVDALAKAINTMLTTPKTQMANVRQRATAFEESEAVDAYLRVLGVQGIQ